MLAFELVPTYEYECPRCPRLFEVRQRITEPALGTCDRCGGPVRRLLSAAPFILKGGGWYVTDYPSEARKKATGSESAPKDSSAKEPAKESAAADSKPSSDAKSSTTPAPAPPSSGGATTSKDPGKASGS